MQGGLMVKLLIPTETWILPMIPRNSGTDDRFHFSPDIPEDRLLP
jgi:hypothetical protein